MKKVTGLVGIFFKCQHPDKMKAWHKTHLGLNTGHYGASLVWKQAADSTKNSSTQ